MPKYYFECECGHEEDFFKPIAEGPPKQVDCPECNDSMYHVMCCNFRLKGDDWPSKGFKSEEYELVKAREEMDNQLAEDDRNQRIVEDVTKRRRKGRKSTDALKSDNPQKWNDYEDAMKKGHRPKEKKSYEIKAMKELNGQIN